MSDAAMQGGAGRTPAPFRLHELEDMEPAQARWMFARLNVVRGLRRARDAGSAGDWEEVLRLSDGDSLLRWGLRHGGTKAERRELASLRLRARAAMARPRRAE